MSRGQEHQFFRVITAEAFTRLLASLPVLPGEECPLAEAGGRVLAADVVAGEDVPAANRSSMDGYAVRAADLFGATEANPGYLECVGDIAIDAPPDFVLESGQCAAIVTGGVLPEGADAVVMIEHTILLGAGTVELRKSVAPLDNVMLRGEDAAAGKTALTAGTRLRPAEVGMLAALGRTVVPVGRKPRVAILSTGDELVPPEATPLPGQIRDVNSAALACMISEAGGLPQPLGLVPDATGALTSAIRDALPRCDVLFLSGGSSVGMRDLTIEALASLPDSEILVHGVAVSPGKPTILATVGGKPVWGLPGQVTSAQVVMFVFGQPFLRHLAGEARPFDLSRRPARRAVLARNVASRQGREDYVRVKLEARPGQPPLAHPRLGKSGLLRTLLEADGLIRIGAGREGLEAGAEVDVLAL